MIKQLFVFFSTLLITTSAFANKIDSLQTDSDVYKFLVEIDTNFRWINVNAYSIIYWDSLEGRIADSLHIKMWQKEDLNNDGQTDLLVYGYAGGSIYLLAIISDNNKYKTYDLSLGAFPPTYFPVVNKDKNKTTVLLYYFSEIIPDKYKNYNFPPETIRGKLTCKTLIYKFNSFIETIDAPSEHSIQNITYSTEQCLGTCPVYKLSINSKRKAIYESEMYSGKPGTYSATIDSSSYYNVVSILNAIDFPYLSDNYKVDWTDAATCHLTVKYDSGKEKKIDDYGLQGTYGLSLLYEELSKLRESQKWKLQK